MRVWCGRAVNMRALWLAAAVAMVALAAAEPAPRHYPAEWRSRDISRPLHDLFEPEPAATALHKERRRARNNKRAHLPSEIASQMMLRASRSSRPYDVPQIGECHSLSPTADSGGSFVHCASRVIRKVVGISFERVQRVLHNNIWLEHASPLHRHLVFNGSSKFRLHGLCRCRTLDNELRRMLPV
ncbi:unnamed protein product, partial [Iphiclides podalirius]